jgi:hypothetical protein
LAQQLESVQASAVFRVQQPPIARVSMAATNVMRYFMMMFLFRAVFLSGTAELEQPDW